MIQVLFAINNTYYVGDGNNLHYLKQFAVLPRDFASRVATILYPSQSGSALTAQYESIMELIDELAPLVSESAPRARSDDAFASWAASPTATPP